MKNQIHAPGHRQARDPDAGCPGGRLPPPHGDGTRAGFLAELAALLGPEHVLNGADAEPYLTDWRHAVTGRALAVARPADTAQVAETVRLCLRHGVPIVPQGGNTGQVAAATPDASGRALVLLLTRLNRVRAVDTDNDTITVEAGCILQAVQQAAADAGRLFPLSLGAEGSCTIGGNLATNAGGTQVLRYGNARELALGLEVVTAEGEIWNGLRGLRKDNTGYDLRDLYIGSEGTLGIITAATLKLYPMPHARHTALLTTASLETATALLNRARAEFGAALTGFEVMQAGCLALVARCFPQQRLPLAAAMDSEWYVLLEITAASDGEAARLETLLAQALADGVIGDAALAASEAHAHDFWHLRESITLALAADGPCVKHDISLPVSQAARFVSATDAELARRFPGVRMRVFGHLGDGNLHYNLAPPASGDPAALEQAIQRVVHDAVHTMGGSISAEQGIGMRRVADLARYKSPVELALMRRIKTALDPRGLMNPGKVLRASADEYQSGPAEPSQPSSANP